MRDGAGVGGAQGGWKLFRKHWEGWSDAVGVGVPGEGGTEGWDGMEACGGWIVWGGWRRGGDGEGVMGGRDRMEMVGVGIWGA